MAVKMPVLCLQDASTISTIEGVALLLGGEMLKMVYIHTCTTTVIVQAPGCLAKLGGIWILTDSVYSVDPTSKLGNRITD